MIDLRELERNFEEISKGLKRRGVEERLLLEVRELFEERRRLIRKIEQLKQERNRLSKEIGKLFREGKREGGELLRGRVTELKVKIEELERLLKGVEERLEEKGLQIPNIPDPDVPVGQDESENRILEVVGEPPQFPFPPKSHDQLGEELGWLDFRRGVKLAKSRFVVMRGEAARLERGLINFFLDHNRSFGYQEVALPYLTNRESLIGTGQFPKFEEEIFAIERDNLYLIPTAEVPLVNLFRDEILELEEPIRLTAYTPCFRREAGSYGQDVKGMIRQHQFDKVEIVAITKPEESDAIFEEMVEVASSLLEKLGLPYRKVMLCTGDLGFSAAKTIDLEVWLPSQRRYREISSISNTREFQARRAKIRYRTKKGNRFVHTLNGSSLAVGRTLVALMENYQQPDGTIKIPKVLKQYL
ncbi:MAG: serine--tRNA ligase [Campylobacterales bacterium]